MKPVKLIGILVPIFLILTGCAMTLHRAVDKNNLAELRTMLEDGADINERKMGWTPLMTAAYHGNIIITEFLIKKGADLNLQKEQHRGFTTRYDGFTALHIAAFYGNTEIARVLLEAGVDPSIRDDKTMTARDYARQFSFMEIVEILDKTTEKKE